MAPEELIKEIGREKISNKIGDIKSREKNIKDVYEKSGQDIMDLQLTMTLSGEDLKEKLSNTLTIEHVKQVIKDQALPLFEDGSRDDYHNTYQKLGAGLIFTVQLGLAKLGIEFGKDGINGTYDETLKTKVQQFQKGWNNLHPADPIATEGLAGKETLTRMLLALDPMSGWSTDCLISEGANVEATHISSDNVVVETEEKKKIDSRYIDIAETDLPEDLVVFESLCDKGLFPHAFYKDKKGKTYLNWGDAMVSVVRSTDKSSIPNGQNLFINIDGAKGTRTYDISSFKDNVRLDGPSINFRSDSPGESFTGSLTEGKRDGQGVYHYANGTIYNGEWKENTYDGAALVSIAGISYETTWDHNTLLTVVVDSKPISVNKRVSLAKVASWSDLLPAAPIAEPAPAATDVHFHENESVRKPKEVVITTEKKIDKKPTEDIDMKDYTEIVDKETLPVDVYRFERLCNKKVFPHTFYEKSDGRKNRLYVWRAKDKKMLPVFLEDEARRANGEAMKMTRRGNSICEIGVFRDDFIQESEKVTKIYEDGASYDGMLEGGRFQGIGTFHYMLYGKPYGYYNGSRKNGLKSGYGIGHFANGNVYEGDWKSNHQNGEAMVTIDGVTYATEWKDNKLMRVYNTIMKDGQMKAVKEQFLNTEQQDITNLLHIKSRKQIFGDKAW